MAYDFDIAELGAAKLDPDTNLPTVQAAVTLSGPDDLEHFGDVDDFSALGVTSLPFPAGDTGQAEGLIARNVGGLDGVLAGSRDKRCAAVYGNLRPGDTALHACDPGASAQVLCKGTKRQVNLVTQDSKGETIAVAVNGTDDKIQLVGFGCIIEISRDQGIVLTETGGALTSSITMKDGKITLHGEVILGGGEVLRNVMVTPAPGALGICGGAALTATGVFVGSTV